MCRACESNYEAQRGQAGRDPALRFARRLKRQGFLPTRHFVERFLQRVLAQGQRFDSRTFRREFLAARHYRQTRPGLHTRIALIRGVPVVYRRGGRTGAQIVLVTALPPGARPPVQPVGAPSLEALWESGKQPRLTRAQQLAQYRQCVAAYPPPAANPKGGQHGSTYRKARQAYLACLQFDPNKPRFMQGWLKQEQRRRRLAAQPRPQSFQAADQKRTAARQARFQAIVADPRQSDAARRWATDQLRRLARGQKRLQALGDGHAVRRVNLRGVPGYDVGHPGGYLKGTKIPLKKLQDPRTFRTEMATQNRARPGLVKRMGLPVKVYGESDLEGEGDPFISSLWDWLRPTPTPTPTPVAPAAVAIIPRSGWGAKAPKCTQTLSTPVRYVFIHHTAGSAPTTESGEQSAMRGTQAYHQNERGWCDIAYNFLIMPSGRVYEGRGWNRVNGATKGYNSNSLAFCWAGNFENIAPTQASIDAVRALLAQGVRDGYLTADFTIRGHRDVASTACPGRNLYARLAELDPR